MSSLTTRIAGLSGEKRDELSARLTANAGAVNSEPIAVIGMGCRYPGGADSPEQLWRLLVEKRDAVREGPFDRWDVDAFYDPDPEMPGRSMSRWGGYLDDIEGFDAAFFGIPPREATAMDPQHRLLLEVSWEALEHAGIPPHGLTNSKTGVFAGLCFTEYSQRLAGRYNQLDAYTGTGNLHSVAAGRVSYLLGLRGPSMAVDTACSSSLVAIHLACQSLRLRESDLALAGGSSLMIRPENMVVGTRWGMYSPVGRCHSFDARADGYVRGEGVGVVVLKRLTDAVADNDRVLAVVRGSAVNQDGRSQGLTAPSAAAQRIVLRAALDQAGVNPGEVGLIETHGTGTLLGDPIEFEALSSVYGSATEPCALGAVKSNIGHAEGAAGVAGFIKSVLALRHGTIPANLNFEKWNPRIPGEESRFFVPTDMTPWPSSANVRLAAVSSFGMSGTNAHMVLEGAPEDRYEVSDDDSRVQIFTLSAGSPEVLPTSAARLADAVEGAPLSDVAHTLASRRSHRSARLAVVASTHSELDTRLRAFAAGESHFGVVQGKTRSGAGRGAVWVFSGQGSQWPGMGKSLLVTEPAFAAKLAEVDRLIAAESGLSVVELLRTNDPLETTDKIQTALFSMHLALAALWRSHGVEPAAVIGHSMGEVSAAVVSGALSISDGVHIMCQRARLTAHVSGAMAFVDLPSPDVLAELPAGVNIAGVLSRRSTVVAGEPAEVDRLVEHWQERGLMARRIAVDIASHSPQVDPILDEFAASISEIVPAEPNVPFYSTVDPSKRQFDAGYWVANLRQPVQFADAVEAAAADGYSVFIEVSPHPTLTHAVSECVEDAVVLPTIRRGHDAAEEFATQLAALYCAGVPIEWDNRGHLVDLPTTTWNRQRHWIDLPLPHPESATLEGNVHPLLGVHVTSPDGTNARVWQCEMSAARLPWLADHQVNGAMVVPGAAIAEMVLAAGCDFFGAEPCDVTVVGLEFERMLLLGDSPLVSTVVTPRTETEAAVEILVSTDGGAEWMRFAAAELANNPSDPPVPIELDAIATEYTTSIDAAALYAALSEAGHHYGTAFAGVSTLHVNGEAGVLARVQIPRAVRADARAFRIHPALLDTSLHPLSAIAMAHSREVGTVVPARIGTLRVLGDTKSVTTCVGRLESPDGGDTVIGYVTLTSDDGTVLATIEQIEFSHIDTDRDPHKTERMLHEVCWEQVDADSSTTAPGNWLVLTEDPASIPGDILEIPLEKDVSEAVTAALGQRDIWDHVVMIAGGQSDDRLGLRRVERIVELVKVITTSQGTAARQPRLWIVTRGGQRVQPSDAITLDHAALRGLGRVTMLEHPELRPTLVDLDPADDSPDALVTELLGDSADDEVAWRGGQRFVARLAASALTRPRRTVHYGQGGFGLDITRPGNLDSLDLVTRPRRAPGPGEIEIQVSAAALNFRDVFIAMGLYPDTTVPLLGGDVAGAVAAVGDGVTDLAVGDTVFGLAAGTFGSFVTVARELVAPVPSGLSAVQAASMPSVYLTAWYGLHHLAGLAPGERVLIHSASGGVGLAAIAIARARGAEIFATAGRESKREYLRGLGIEHVMDSRSLDFVEQTLEATGGVGVDVVLNSLSGPALAAGLDVLAIGGRFLEIGKRDIYADTKVGLLPFRRGLTMSSIDLDLLARLRPNLVASLLGEVVDEIESGRMDPLPYTEFPLENAVDAFRTMAAASHIGKLVLTVPSDGETSATVSDDIRSAVLPDGGYVVTGGLGGIGVEVAAWLARLGAGRIVLNSRSEADDRAAAKIAELRSSGTDVEVVIGDIGAPGVAERLVAAAVHGGHQLRGVLHCAGLLADALLVNLSAERIAECWTPKVDGAWRLHEATAEHDLDFFVLFSSLAGLVGNPGQGAYAAANTWLDAFALWRRDQGLPAVSVAWGAWDGEGMASRLDSERGYPKVNPGRYLDTLEVLIKFDVSRIGVFPWAPDKFQTIAPFAGQSSFFARMPFPISERSDVIAGSGIGPELSTMYPRQRAAMVTSYLAKCIGAILTVDSSDLDPDEPLANLGFDSLTALQLRNHLEGDFDLRIPATAIWTYPTMTALGGYLLGRLGLSSDVDNVKSEQSATRTFLCYTPRESAVVRLYCFPHLGGAASAYRPWVGTLPPWIELHAAQLPGRENRSAEQPLSDLRKIVAELADAIADDDERPAAFFGHSGGCLLALETARELRRRGRATPVFLGVSGMAAPHRLDVFQRLRESVLADPVAAVPLLGGISEEVARDADVLAHLAPMMEADAAMLNGYEYYPEAPLDCSVSTFAGIDDPVYSPSEVESWSEHAVRTQASHRYPGGHFYLRDRLADLVADLSADLTAALKL